MKQHLVGLQTLKQTSGFLACVSFITLIPSIFFNFQSLHDGYVLETALLARETITELGFYPFSQYGPLWTFTLGFIALISRDELLLLSIRIFSIFCYSVSIGLSVKILQFFGRQYLGPLITLFFATTWYLFGPYHGWPSTLVLPLALLFAHLLVKILILKPPSVLAPLMMGGLITLIQFGRIQIGILMLLLTLVFLIYSQNIKYAVALSFGYLCSTLIALIPLAIGGILSDVLYDHIVFAFSFHLSSDRGATRVPIWTIVIALIVVLAVHYFRRKPFIGDCLIRILLLAFLCMSFVIVTIEIFRPSEITSNLRWFYLQRLYVGLMLGLTVATLFESVNKLRAVKRSGLEDLSRPTASLGLSLVAFAVFAQNYPLFTAHHTWYASLPVLVSTSLLIERVGIHSQVRFNTFLFSASIIIGAIFILSWTIQNALTHVRAPITQIVWVNTKDERMFIDMKAFLDKHLIQKATVSNFCYDPLAFVVRPDLKSASRIFVWWENFENIAEYRVTTKRLNSLTIVCRDRLPTLGWYLDQERLKEIDTSEELGVSLFKTD